MWEDDEFEIEWELGSRQREWIEIKKGFEKVTHPWTLRKLISKVCEFGPRNEYEYTEVAELKEAVACFEALNTSNRFYRRLEATLLNPSCDLLHTPLVDDNRALVRYFVDLVPSCVTVNHTYWGLPIHWVQSFEMLKLLGEHGADPKVESAEGQLFLEHCAYIHDRKSLEWIVERWGARCHDRMLEKAIEGYIQAVRISAASLKTKSGPFSRGHYRDTIPWLQRRITPQDLLQVSKRIAKWYAHETKWNTIVRNRWILPPQLYNTLLDEDLSEIRDGHLMLSLSFYHRILLHLLPDVLGSLVFTYLAPDFLLIQLQKSSTHRNDYPFQGISFLVDTQQWLRLHAATAQTTFQSERAIVPCCQSERWDCLWCNCDKRSQVCDSDTLDPLGHQVLQGMERESHAHLVPLILSSNVIGVYCRKGLELQSLHESALRFLQEIAKELGFQERIKAFEVEDFNVMLKCGLRWK